MAETEIREWLESAPSAARLWLRSTAMGRFVREERRKSFNAPGRYDGAMSEACKALCVAEYETLTEIWNWLQTGARP